MSRHNPAKRRAIRPTDSVPVMTSVDAALMRSLPGRSSLTAWVWSRVVADYVQLSQNGHCLAMSAQLESADAEPTTAYTRESLAARGSGDELTGSYAGLERIVTGPGTWIEDGALHVPAAGREHCAQRSPSIGYKAQHRWAGLLRQCRVGDECFLALRRRPAGGDVKPPHAALAEDRGRER